MKMLIIPIGDITDLIAKSYKAGCGASPDTHIQILYDQEEPRLRLVQSESSLNSYWGMSVKKVDTAD